MRTKRCVVVSNVLCVARVRVGVKWCYTPNGLAGDIVLLASPLAFFPSCLGFLLEELNCEAAKLVLQAQAERLSVEEYIRARISLSPQCRLVWLREFAKILLSLRLTIVVGRKASEWSQTRASGRSGKDVRKRS